MKTTGIVFVTLGILAFLGYFIGGSGLPGSLILIGLGSYLIHRANERDNP